MLGTGCSWRSLPRDLPRWITVYAYFRRWQRDGTWSRVRATLRRLWADGACDSAPLAAELAAWGCTLEIIRPPPGTRGFAAVPKRWTVERTFARLTHQRRLRVDYEHLPAVVEAFIDLTMIRLLARRLARHAYSYTVSEYRPPEVPHRLTG